MYMYMYICVDFSLAKTTKENTVHTQLTNCRPIVYFMKRVWEISTFTFANLLSGDSIRIILTFTASLLVFGSATITVQGSLQHEEHHRDPNAASIAPAVVNCACSHHYRVCTICLFCFFLDNAQILNTCDATDSFIMYVHKNTNTHT